MLYHIGRFVYYAYEVGAVKSVSGTLLPWWDNYQTRCCLPAGRDEYLYRGSRVEHSWQCFLDSSHRSGHKGLVFGVAVDVFLNKSTDRNDCQVVLARIFQCGMS